MSVVSSLPPSTANWHWKNKNLTSWGKTWFERELTTIEVKEGEQAVSISEVTEVDGDIELGQRKSKLITIFDCAIDLKWDGTASDGSSVSGRLKIPEVSHETAVDGSSDYTYNWSLSTTSSQAVDALFAFAKARLPAALEAKFSQFSAAMIETHGKDLQAAGSQEPSRSGTPQPTSASASASAQSSVPAASGPTSKVVKEQKKSLNTSKVEVEGQFMASADDLFDMLTDESKIPMWTRAAAQSKPEPGQPFTLFSGGVKGEFVSVEKPKQVVQKWALSSPTWPSDHFATLTMTFDQSSDSTKLTLSLEGVPIGQEDEMRRNMDGYYLQGLKSIGYVQLVYSEPPSPPPSTSRYRKASKKQEDIISAENYSRVIAIVLAAIVVVAAFAIPYLQK